MHFNAAPYCLPAPEEVPNTAATLLKPLGDAIPQVIRWYGRWCHLDPDEPHVHLGPIGVAPERQGQGIGTALMHRYIEHLDREKAAAILKLTGPRTRISTKHSASSCATKKTSSARRPGTCGDREYFSGAGSQNFGSAARSCSEYFDIAATSSSLTVILPLNWCWRLSRVVPSCQTAVRLSPKAGPYFLEVSLTS